MTIINLSKDVPVWLVTEEILNWEFRNAVKAVRKIYKQSGGGARGSMSSKIDAAFRYGIDLSHWGIPEFELLLAFTFRGSEIRMDHIDSKLHSLPNAYDDALAQFFRMVFIFLWTRKVFIAPLSIQTINHLPESFDLLCELADLECLSIIRSVHPQSRIESIFKRDELSNRSSRVNFWLRLLLSTNFYDVNDITGEGCKILFDGGNGTGELPLRRYYVNDFLLTITRTSPAKKEVVEGIVNRYVVAKSERKSARVYKGRRITQKMETRTPAQEAYEAAFRVARALAHGEIEFMFEPVFKTYFPSHRIKGLFSLGEAKDGLK